MFSISGVNSYAASSETYSFYDCSYKWERGGQEDYSNSVVATSATVEGTPVVWMYNTNPNAYPQGLAKFLTTMRISDFNIDDEYKISFDSTVNCAVRYSVWVYLCDKNGNAISDFLYSETFDDKLANSNHLQHNEWNFTLKNLGLNSNQNVYLAIGFIVSQDFSQTFRIGGTDVTITNLDDNSAFFDGVWGTIKHIFYAIVGGTCDDGDYSTEGLFGKLKSGLDSLGTRIGDFFSDFKQNWNAGIEAIKQKFKDISEAITNKLHELKEGITNKLNEVKNGIVTVIENIKEDLKALFIPSDDYFDNYKNKWLTFAEEHLGLVYQVTDITVTLVKRVQSIMLSDSYVFTFPAIKVPINGVTYTFLEEQKVNIDMWIKGNGGSSAPAGLLYDVYTVCVWAVFAFALVKYASKVEGHIFGVGGDEDDS